MIDFCKHIIFWQPSTYFLRRMLLFVVCAFAVCATEVAAADSIEIATELVEDVKQVANEDMLPVSENDPASSIDMADLIFHHVGDAHSFHFFTYNGHEVGIHLPIILYSTTQGWSFFMSSKFGAHGEDTHASYALRNGSIVQLDATGAIDQNAKVYDFSVTRNVAQMLLACVILFFVLRSVGRHYSKTKGYDSAPRGLVSWIEPMVLFMEREVFVPNLGVERAPKYTPFLLSLFFFLLVNNLLGLVPGAANVTGNIAFTMTLAVFSFVVIMANSRKYYWKHIFWPPGPLFIKFILIPIEIIGIFTKPFALMIRLFANMLAGHIIILCFIALIFIFAFMNKVAGITFIPFSIAFTIFMYCIELLVACIQAFIFVNLTVVFIAQAAEEEPAVH